MGPLLVRPRSISGRVDWWSPSWGHSGRVWAHRGPEDHKRRKDQLRYYRSLYDWVVYLKVLVREKLFCTNLECWDQTRRQVSPKAPGTKSNFGKERVHREVLSKNVNLMSVVLARQNSEKYHMRRPCTKKEPPAKQRGNCEHVYKLNKFGQSCVLYSY